MERGGNGRIWWDQLDKLLAMPIGIATEMPRPSLPLHPQDASFILEVAGHIDRGESAALWAPYLTAESLALLARALVVATVNRPKVALYSSDLAVPRLYSSLYGVVTRLRSAFPMRTELPYARSLSQLEFCAGRAESLVLDARRWRNKLQVQKALAESNRFLGARIFVLRDGWTNAATELGSSGIPVTPVRPVGEVLPNGWPALAAYLRRANNFAAGTLLSPATVLTEAPPLRALERSATRLIRAARGVPGSGAAVFLADTANTLMQNACLPVTLYRKAAAETGSHWADRFAAVLQASLAYGCPDELRGLVYGFLNDFRAAEDYVGHEHPPKVTWVKELLIRSGPKSRFAFLCASDVEAEAVRLWGKSSTSEGCASLTPVGRAEVESGSVRETLLVPGPLRSVDSWMVVSGVASEIRVVAYPWQANRWRYLSRHVSRLVRTELPAIEDIDADEADVEYSYWPTVTFASPRPLLEEDDMDAMARDAEGRTHALRVVIVKTDQGDLTYRENSLVPTVELNRLVDWLVTLLRPNNKILIRSDGGGIDARRRVDELAESDPFLSATAERAAVWRDLLTVRWKAEGCSARELHRRLFPAHEITYAGFRDWIVNPSRIGPNNVNIIRLLTRLGLEPEAANEVREDLRRYRSYRARVYAHLWKLAKRQASLYAGQQDVADPLEDDARIDPELGLTLLGLEELVTFATVLEAPTFRKGGES